MLARVSATEMGAAIAANLETLRKPGVLSVRPGYKVVDGWPTRKPAIVVTVARKTPSPPDDERLPETLAGFAVDVREASPLKRLQESEPAAYERLRHTLRPEQQLAEFKEEQPLARARDATTERELVTAKPRLPYLPPSGADLSPVEDHFKITCHASPDAGWPTLSTFLAGTRERLVVALYDFTSAHILSSVEAALEGRRMDLVLDHPARNPTADQSDDETQAALERALGPKLGFAWALDGRDPHAAAAIFESAYHIKVAVRDGRLFWLSSGNWNNSNQPDIDPVAHPDDAKAAMHADRDWHVVVEHVGVSKTFEAFIENDLEVASAHQATEEALMATELDAAAWIRSLPPKSFAQFFAPKAFEDRMKIQPLLTPDPGVYSGAVIELIRATTKSLYIQQQYAHPSASSDDRAFAELLQAVAERQRAGVDVRIIFSQWETTSYLEQLQAVGFDLAQIRIQQGVHNKGIVSDGERVLVSSQNWSAPGVLRNRDAGLIIEHPGIADYFEAIFMHDWTNLALQKALDD